MGRAQPFWDFVETGGGCWEWRGLRDDQGYGRRRRLGKKSYAHRIAWEMLFGPIPVGMYVCHRCDNPPCCRPDHLFLGTPSDNARDREAKGRSNHPRGERWFIFHCRPVGGHE